jgi:hypothetical protein
VQHKVIYPNSVLNKFVMSKLVKASYFSPTTSGTVSEEPCTQCQPLPSLTVSIYRGTVQILLEIVTPARAIPCAQSVWSRRQYIPSKELQHLTHCCVPKTTTNFLYVFSSICLPILIWILRGFSLSLPRALPPLPPIFLPFHYLLIVLPVFAARFVVK